MAHWLGLLAEGDHGNIYYSGSQLGMLLPPKKIFGNGLIMRLTEAGSGVPAGMYCLGVQNP